MHSVRMQKDLCPQCGSVLNGAVNLEGKFTPRAGDVTVCAYCATFLKFDEFVLLRILPEHEFEKLHPDEQTQLLYVKDLVVKAHLENPKYKLQSV